MLRPEVGKQVTRGDGGEPVVVVVEVVDVDVTDGLKELALELRFHRSVDLELLEFFIVVAVVSIILAAVALSA